MYIAWQESCIRWDSTTRKGIMMYEIGLALMAGGVTGFLLFSERGRQILKRFMLGLPNIRIDELMTLLPPDEEITVLADSPRRKIPWADISVQLRCGEVSVIYNRTDRDSFFAETVDILTPQKAGIIFTMRDETLVALEYIGGRTIRYPHISMNVDEKRAVASFLRRIREAVRDQK